MSVTFDGLTFDRIGHASVRIEDDDGWTIYIDPWANVLDGTPSDGNLVIVTHDDRDHFDAEGIEAVAAEDATIAAYDRVDTGELAEDVTDLPHDDTTTVDGIDIRTVPAHNDPDGRHVDEDGQPFHAPGEVVGVLFTVGDTTVYYPSDTDFLDELEEITADVFIPPIGGHYTMDRHEAADFARSVDPELVLPVHYDTFEAIEADAEAFAEELEEDDIQVELF